MTYDVFADDSEHVVIGYQQMRIGYIAHCLGIPASTLAGLRDGSLVAVPRPTMWTADTSKPNRVSWSLFAEWDGSQIEQVMAAFAAALRALAAEAPQ